MSTEAKEKPQESETPFSKMMGAWTGFAIVTVIMIVLFRTAWWIIFPIIGSFSGAVKETQKYYSLKVKCPNCGETLTPGTRFCSHCGITIPTECPNCHKPVKGGLKFCAECGAPLFSAQIRGDSGEGGQEPGVTKKFCGSCGSEINPGQIKCPTCGLSLE